MRPLKDDKFTFEKKFWKKSLNVPSVKLFSIFLFQSFGGGFDAFWFPTFSLR